jgi:hypothetical protein
MSVASAEMFVPKNGDRVFLQYDEESIGSVTAAGVEVSKVTFDRHATRCIPNRHLRRLSSREMMEAKMKVKDLIAMLQKEDQEALVIKYNDGGTTVTGPIAGISRAPMIGPVQKPVILIE